MTTGINQEILTWARERNKLTIEELAQSMKREPEEIRMWESGDKIPSYTLLEELAYRHFNIPLAVFFFPEPPSIEDPINKFRRLPDYEYARLSSDTLRMIRLSQGYQDSLKALIDINASIRRIFLDIDSQKMNPIQLATHVRKYIGITIEQQFVFDGQESAFKAWRHAIENVGVFTFKGPLKDKFISGFALLDDQFPVIFINNASSFSRQTFTLIHELGHILYNIHGVTDVNEEYIDYMNESDQALEIKCNAFAAELLVPNDVFEKDKKFIKNVNEDIIVELAYRYSVSREVILRKFLDHGDISRECYLNMSSQWNNDYLRLNYNKQGGNWYLTKLAYLGEGFTQLVFNNYYNGRISKTEMGYHLNINSKNIDKLEAYLSQ